VSFPLTLVCATLGGAVGLCVPRIAYRLSVDYATPLRSACAMCGRPFAAGVYGWLGWPDAGVGRPAHAGRGQALWSPSNRAALAGRCPDCGARHGPAPWLTGPVGVVAFGAIAWALGPVTGLPAFLVLAGHGVLLGSVDLGCRRLPDLLVGSAFAGCVVPLALATTVDGTPDRLLRAAFGATAMGVSYLVLALLPRSGLGFGDVKLAGVLGLALGWLGWPAVLLGLALPHLLGGPVAVVLLLTGRAERETALPFGPALLAGALLAVVITAHPA
jgi:leader peptidase (prepilin peptidase)/N-methyltransferase